MIGTIVEELPSLQGVLSSTGSLYGQLSVSSTCFGVLSIPEQVSTDIYLGPYSIIPKAYESQILSIKNKTASDDIVISKIPKYSASNRAEGYTVTIAEEV